MNYPDSERLEVFLHVARREGEYRPACGKFSFLFYGLTGKSVPLVLIGLFILDDMGHTYDYFFVRNRDHWRGV